MKELDSTITISNRNERIRFQFIRKSLRIGISIGGKEIGEDCEE